MGAPLAIHPSVSVSALRCRDALALLLYALRSSAFALLTNRIRNVPLPDPIVYTTYLLCNLRVWLVDARLMVSIRQDSRPCIAVLCRLRDRGHDGRSSSIVSWLHRSRAAEMVSGNPFAEPLVAASTGLDSTRNDE